MATSLRQCVRDVSAYLILLIFVAVLGPLQFGYHIAELNAPQEVITCRKKAIQAPKLETRVLKWFASSKPESTDADKPGWLPDCIPMSDAAFSTIAAVYTIGGLLGALAAGPMASRRGRLPAMRATAACFLVGAGIETISMNPVVMGLGRLISGVGAGASTVIVPLYISEVSPPNERGMFGAMTQVSINVGILSSQTLGFFLSYGSAWRWILAIGFFVSVAQASGLLVVPESPAWLAAHGNPARARKVLQRIRGSGFDINGEAEGWHDDEEEATEAERLLVEGGEEGVPPTPVANEQVKHMGFIQVVRDPLTRPAIVACVGIMFAQQFCGINSIIMYSVFLLTDLLPVSSALLTIIISVVNLCTTIACAPLPDRIGRKTCLLTSIIGQGSSSFLLALSIVLGLKVMSAISVLLFVAFFAVGLGPVPFIMASELVGHEAVGATQSWALASNYVATFLVAQFFLIVNNWMNSVFGGAGWVYFIFAGFALLSVIFVSVKVPETKGKKDMDEVWGRTRRID